MSTLKFKSLLLLTFLLLQTTHLLFAQTDCIYDGNDSAWVSGFNYPGTASATPTVSLSTDSALIVVGGFISFAGAFQDIRCIGLWNGADWYPIMQNFMCTSCGLGYQESLTSDEDGNLYVGGFFEGVKNLDGSEIAAENIAKYNSSTGLWEPLGIGLETDNGRVQALLVQNGYLYAGGRITQAYNLTDTIPINNLARYNLTTGIWEDVDGGVGTIYTSSGASPNGEVYDLETDADGSLIVAGGLSWVGPDQLPVHSIARWSETNGWDNFDGGLPSSYYADGIVASRVLDVELTPGSAGNAIYAVGYFQSYDDDQPVPELLAKWTQGNGWQQVNIGGFDSSGNFPAFKTLDYNAATQELYVGGNFSYPGSNNIVSLDLETGTYATFDGGTDNINDGDVTSIAHWQGDIYALGANSEYGSNLLTPGIARWDGDSWHALGNGLQTTGSKFNSVVQDGNEVYAAGFFNIIGGANHFSIARFLIDEDQWDPTFDLSLRTNPTASYADAYVYAMEKEGDWLTIAGKIKYANQTAVNNVFRYNVVTNEIDTLGGGIDGSYPSVLAILHSGDSLIVGGTFDSAGGESATNIASWNGETWHGLDFPGSSNNTVQSLLNSGDTAIYVGGYLSFSIDGVTSRGISAYEDGEWKPVGQGFSYNGRILSMQRDPNTGYIVMGGFFSDAKQTDGTVLPAQRLIYWDGNSYLPFEDISENVSKLKYGSDSTLYVCSTGEMNILGEDFHCLARYKPSYGWANFGTSLRNRLTPTLDDASVVDITFSDDGSVATVIGEFTFSGVHNAYGIARYVLDNPEDLVLLAAAFEPTITAGTVDYTNLTENANGYLWDFGDEGTDDTTNPSHTYENSGTYTVSLTAFNACDTVTISHEIVIIITGLTEKGGSEIRMYPNPAKDKITLSGMENRGLENMTTATLFSPEGRKIATYKLNGTEKQDLHLPATLASGIYFISLHGDTHTYTKRLIILKFNP